MTTLDAARRISKIRSNWPAWKRDYKLTDYRTSDTGTVKLERDSEKECLKMNKHTLGIIGQGFVGNAFREGMKHAFCIETYDKFVHERSTCKSIAELVAKTDIIYVSVPTPMRRSGECDLSIVRTVLGEVFAAVSNDTRLEVVIRSTIPPGSTDAFNREYGERLDVIFNPEFLTEVNAVSDFKKQDRIVLGYGVPAALRSDVLLAEHIYRCAFPGVPIKFLPAAAAEMVKYTTNIFLATKVSLANELWQVCQAADIDYDEMIDVAKLDKRLGQSHWMVPGPPQVHDTEPRFGFGGHCFPKDLNSLRFLAQQAGVTPTMMIATWEKNLAVRQGAARDWEGMTGRAVSDD
jgi:nucleotide sugar dehydrogenase